MYIKEFKEFKELGLLSKINDLILHYKKGHDEDYKEKALMVREEIERLQREIEKLRADREKLVEALRFYADRSRYDRNNQIDSCDQDEFVYSDFMEPCKSMVGGKLARTTLKELGEME